MENLKDLWVNVLKIIKEETNDVSYNTWFTPTVAHSIDESTDTIYIKVQNSMIKNIINSRYHAILSNAVKSVFKKEYKISIFLDGEKIEESSNKAEKEKDVSREMSTPFNPKYNFNTFVAGSNNRYAHAAALAVAESPSCLSKSNKDCYNPLFLYGGSGLGKTHLMNAIGTHIHLNYPDLKVLYVSSEMFTNELIKAISERKTGEFKSKYRKIDVLLIDDIQFIEGKESTQEEFFHTFNALYEANKQIIISSDRPPSKLVDIEERLRSRFQWNMIADIQPADYENRVAILMKKAELENLKIDENLIEVINLIAGKFKTNIRELEGAFTRVVAFGAMFNRTVDIPLAKEVLKDIISSTEELMTPELIKKYVCKHFNIKLSDMDSSKRTRNIAYPRQIAMYLCRELTDLSLPKIGESFNGKDHTTIMHGCNKISDEIQTNEVTKKAVEDIIRELNEIRK